MEVALSIVAGLLVSTTLILVGMQLSKLGIRDAYAAGRRAAFRDARRLVRERAALATELAPTGQLMYGLVRAQMADQIEADLQELA